MYARIHTGKERESKPKQVSRAHATQKWRPAPRKSISKKESQRERLKKIDGTGGLEEKAALIPTEIWP